MAVIQIPNLPGVVGLSGAELFEGVQSGTSVKISLSQIIAATRGGLPTTLPIPVDVGGTGIASFAVGDIMYASAPETLSKLPAAADGNALLSGTSPSWGKVGLTTHVSGVLPVANGGTNQSGALTAGGVVYGNTTTSMATTAAGTSTQVLHGGATPTFGAVSLTTDVSGTLPVANGGTGTASSGSATQVLHGNSTWGAVSLTADVSGVLPVANGGTNISSYTAGDIPYASAPGVLSTLADVATGNALISGGVGAAPSYGKIGLTTHVDGTLPVANGGTGTASSGTATQVLHGNSTWGAVSLTADVSGTLPVANGGTGATTGAGAFANMMGFTSTPTAAGATTLTNTSSQYQVFTGTLNQTIFLPVTSTLTTGWTFHIVNNSTGPLNVRASSGTTIDIVYSGMTMMVTCIDTTVTTPAAWEYGFTDFGSITGTGANVLATSPTVTTPILSGNIGAGGASYGTAGQVLTSGGTGANTSWADPPPNLQPFTVSGTWTKPTSARLVLVRVWGAGGGGAGGGVGAAAVAKYGGSGGGGGAYYEKYFYANQLPATVAVTVGNAGTGGASGAVGVAGGASSFGAFITCAGGGGGVLAAGTNAGGGAQSSGTSVGVLYTPSLFGGANSNAYYGGAGGGAANIGAGYSSQFGGGGGGPGGGENASNVLQVPFAGGQSNNNTGVGAAGTSVAGAPTAGGAATGPGCGGGGGGSAQTVNGAAGGAGAFPGGGGGGGGSTRTGFLGGAGGAGGAGYVEVYTW